MRGDAANILPANVTRALACRIARDPAARDHGKRLADHR
jgi:hypothetical protein